MFTGIVEAVGHITSLEYQGKDIRMAVVCDGLDMANMKLGDSVAINGVCLTVVKLQSQGFEVDVSAVTLACTTYGELSVGDPVNLEQALLPTTRLGGHLVSGHVDGVARVMECRNAGHSQRIVIEVPAALSKYLAVKGSVCVDGISLTINEVDGHCFSVNIIAHTQQHTNINYYRPGLRVNIEVDIIARYLERMLTATGDESGIDQALLMRTGFMQG